MLEYSRDASESFVSMVKTPLEITLLEPFWRPNLGQQNTLQNHGGLCKIKASDAKINPKTDPESAQNRPQIGPKSSPKRSKIEPKSASWGGPGGRCDSEPILAPFLAVLEAPGAALGRPRGRLGRVLGRLGGVLGRPGGVLGASWGLPGASWGRLGTVLGRPGAVLSVIFWLPFPNSFSEPFWDPFPSHFGPFLEPSWKEKTTKNHGGLCKIKDFSNNEKLIKTIGFTTFF